MQRRSSCAEFFEAAEKPSPLKLTTPGIHHELKILRIAFNSACRAGLMQANHAIQVENLYGKQKRGAEAKKSRRPFTVEELRKLLSVADQEWRDLILFGVYTGQRPGDLIALTGGNLYRSYALVRVFGHGLNEGGQGLVSAVTFELIPGADRAS